MWSIFWMTWNWTHFYVLVQNNTPNAIQIMRRNFFVERVFMWSTWINAMIFPTFLMKNWTTFDDTMWNFNRVEIFEISNSKSCITSVFFRFTDHLNLDKNILKVTKIKLKQHWEDDREKREIRFFYKIQKSGENRPDLILKCRVIFSAAARYF